MKITVKNLGALKKAEFSLGDITIICGENNTGKSYATYALFGFLSNWRKVVNLTLPKAGLDELLGDGIIQIDLQDYLDNLQNILLDAGKEYTKTLPDVFATNPDHFKGTEFSIEVKPNQKTFDQYHKSEIGSEKTQFFQIRKEASSSQVTVTLLAEKDQIGLPRDIIDKVIVDTLRDILFQNLFPNVFIASVERTGTSIFRKELNFARNRLLEELIQSTKDVNPLALFSKDYDNYALPIRKNVEFTRNLESVVKQQSFIAQEHPQVLQEFAQIIGGEYQVTDNDELYYMPDQQQIRLSMDESSSAVRSLLDIGFYLKHIAKLNDLLMVDEPELNLHPENQRRLARLFARLANIGVKVFITTHSDYIIKELNTLLMLNQDKSYLKRIAQEEGYQSEELLSVDKVKAYLAEKRPLELSDDSQKTHYQTLIPAKITSDFGIEITSFDTAINEMNRIQESIVWEED
ncbi:MAG: AAA family ATPase [Cyanobacteria bacterium P01_G01_bin.54]